MKTAIVIITALIIIFYIISIIAEAYIKSDKLEILKISNNIPTTANVVRGLSLLTAMILVGIDVILVLILIL